MIKINPLLFFFVLFSVLGFLGKWIRGQFGLNMVVLDPNLFFIILVAKFFGFKWLLLYLFFNVIVADVLTNLMSAGSFLNYVLYHIAPLIGIFIFGNMGMMVYGNIASIIYSVGYVFGRTVILPDDPFKVYSKAITSFIFTFLYISFFGPLFELLLNHLYFW